MRVLTLNDNGQIVFREAKANGSDSITLQGPAALAAGYTLTLPAALPGSLEFLTVDAAGQLATSSGSAGSLDQSYDVGRIITADAGPVEAAGAGGFLASHSAPVYGLETTGVERNYRLTAGQTAGILEIQVGAADGDISDDAFTVGLSLDGTNRRLGLGTVAPATLAHLVTPSGDAKVTLESAVTSDASVIFDEAGTARWELGYDQSAGGLVVGRLSFTNPALFFEDTTGDIGIGTLTPDAKLDLVQSAAAAALEVTCGAATSILVGQANDNRVLEILKTGLGAGEPLFIDNDGTGIGAHLIQDGNALAAMRITQNANQRALDINKEGLGAGACIDAQQRGTDDVIFCNQDGNGPGITIDSEATSDPLILLEPLASTNARGDIRFGQRTAGASAPLEGDVWYDAGDHRLEFSDGLQTRALGSRFGPGFGPVEDKTIATGAITATSGHMRLTSESTTSDILTDVTVTGTGPKVGDTILLRAADTHSITLDTGAGNLRLDGGTDKVLNTVNDAIVLMWDGSVWNQISFGNNPT